MKRIETRTWQEYTMIDEVCVGEGGKRARQAQRQQTGYCYPVWGWVTYSSTSTVYEPNDGAVPAKYSVGSTNAGINDGGQIPAPKGLIKSIIVEGVNHSEMGNNWKVREEIKKAFEGKHERNIFWIQSK